MNYPIANTKLLISQHMLATAANKRLDVDYTASLWSLLNQRDLLRNLALVNCWAQHLTNRCKNNTVPNATKMGTVTEQNREADAANWRGVAFSIRQLLMNGANVQTGPSPVLTQLSSKSSTKPWWSGSDRAPSAFRKCYQLAGRLSACHSSPGRPFEVMRIRCLRLVLPVFRSAPLCCWLLSGGPAAEDDVDVKLKLLLL